MVQLGWRQSNADRELYAPLFAFAYLEEMHLIKHGETVSKWMKFNDDLFRTQDGFIGKDKTSYNSIKVQFEKRIAEFKHTFGWENGKCKNNSGEEGDLTEPDATIRNMLKEKHDDAEAKKCAENDNKEVNQNEMTVLLNNMSSQSKKRPRNKLDSSNNGNHSGTKVGNSVDDIISSTLQSFSSSLASPGVKKLKKALETVVEEKMLTHFKDRPIAEIFTKAGINFITLPAETITRYEEVGVSTLVNIFCTPNMNFDAVYVKKEWRECNVEYLHAAKLYSYFTVVKNEFI